MFPQIDLATLPVAPAMHWVEAFGSWLHSDHRKFGKRGTLSVNSIDAYLQDARHLDRFYEHAYAESFSPGILNEALVNSYFEWMDMNRVAPATFNRRLATVKLMSQWLGIGDVTLCVERKVTEYEPRDKTPDEYQALETVAGSMSHLRRQTEKHAVLGERDQIAFRLMGIPHGLRISEVEGLNVDDVNFTRLQIRVRGKGGSDQKIEISDEMAALISQWIKRMPKPVEDDAGMPLFVDWDGKRVTGGQLRRRLKLIGEKANVDVTCHDLRASMGCQFYGMALQQTGSQYAAADATRRQMRHRDFRTTQKNYLRASRTQIRAVVDKPLDKMTLEELLDLMIDTPHKTMRSMVRNEILRREKKFRKSVEGALKEVEEDERLGYPTATVDVNAPLALIQCALPAPSEGFEICIDGAGCEGRGRMNLKDRFAEFVLAAFDRFMDFITLGTWTRVQGEVMWKKMKVKE